MSATIELPVHEAEREYARTARDHIYVNRDDPAIQPTKYLWRRQRFDRLVAVFLLIPGVPLILVLSALVRLSSRGRAIFRQQRVGKDGHVFEMYKIRTMIDNAEEISGPSWSLEKDWRITRVGRALRKLHLDELPQLFNVVRGEMALIGPRPERPEFVGVLKGRIPNYLDRQCTLPGITGLAQINLPADSGVASVRRKLALDRRYIENVNMALDIRIMLCTMIRLLGVSGELARRWMWLHREVPDSPPTGVLNRESLHAVEQRMSNSFVVLEQLLASDLE